MRRTMNNNGFVFNPFYRYQNINDNQIEYDKLLNKIERLEKNIRILENRVNLLEKKESKIITNEEPTDMYMI